MPDAPAHIRSVGLDDGPNLRQSRLCLDHPRPARAGDRADLDRRERPAFSIRVPPFTIWSMSASYDCYELAELLEERRRLDAQIAEHQRLQRYLLSQGSR